MVFGISPLQADEAQDVMHFNYTAWPDHGVPPANAAEHPAVCIHGPTASHQEQRAHDHPLQVTFIWHFLLVTCLTDNDHLRKLT